MTKWTCLLACTAVLGCSNKKGTLNDGGVADGGVADGGVAALKSNIGVDLSHIVAFAVGDGKLLALDDHGNLLPASVLTSGDAVPTEIADTPQAVYFTFRNLSVAAAVDGGQTLCNVLLRKSDGALFCLDALALLGLAWTPLPVEHDANGDNLFVGNSSILTRIDVTGPAPQSTVIFEASGTMPGIDAYTVNDAGDAMLRDGSGARVVAMNGGSQTLSASANQCQWHAGNDFYYVKLSGTQLQRMQVLVRQARQADGSYVASDLATAGASSTSACNVVLGSPTYAWGWGTSYASVPTTGLVDMFVRAVHPVPGIATISSIAAAGPSAIYVQGTDAAGKWTIARVEIPSLAATSIVPAGEITLTAMSVSRGGDLSFAGLRNADGAHVIGNVPAGGNTYSIVSATAPTVTTLQRIN